MQATAPPASRSASEPRSASEFGAWGRISRPTSTLVACAGTATGAANPSPDPTRNVTAHGTFAAAPATPPTYDSTLVPVGATATVTAGAAGTGTSVTLAVTGLQPNRRYGAHAHTKPCGGDG